MSTFNKGPAQIVAITINEDGTYHEVRIDVVPSEASRTDDGKYDPTGAELMSHESGVRLPALKQQRDK